MTTDDWTRDIPAVKKQFHEWGWLKVFFTQLNLTYLARWRKPKLLLCSVETARELGLSPHQQNLTSHQSLLSEKGFKVRFNWK